MSIKRDSVVANVNGLEMGESEEGEVGVEPGVLLLEGMVTSAH